MVEKHIAGGLGLFVGESQLAFAEKISQKKSIYIQVLQPDDQTAKRLGDSLIASSFREKIGVRNATFLTEHYDSKLFNLIVVKDMTLISNSSLKEMNRILIAKGLLVMDSLPNHWKLDESFTVIQEKPQLILQKKSEPLEWHVCDSVKWRAGSRAQLSSGWGSIHAGDQKFFYRQRFEVPGSLDVSTAELVARDAYNGSLLWRIEDDAEYQEKEWKAFHNVPLVAVNGKVFTVIKKNLFVWMPIQGKSHLS